MTFGISVLRICIAALCGAAVGAERTIRLKEAGIRTHVIVCCTSALVMIISKYGFYDVLSVENEFFRADPARLAAQIVSGISFLGAGVIFRNGSTLKGLTTAAGVWGTAGIGLAVGAGMYGLGIFAAVFIAGMQLFMHKYTFGADSYENNFIVVVMDNVPGTMEILRSFLDSLHCYVVDNKVSREDDSIRYSVNIKTKGDVSMETLNDFIASHPEVRSASCTQQ